jgi:hypothetical protein
LTIELSLINQKKINSQKELVREVEMGPFKHTVDDGLDRGNGASHSDGIALVKVAINNSFFFFAHKYIELKVKCFINKKYH